MMSFVTHWLTHDAQYVQYVHTRYLVRTYVLVSRNLLVSYGTDVISSLAQALQSLTVSVVLAGTYYLVSTIHSLVPGNRYECTAHRRFDACALEKSGMALVKSPVGVKNMLSKNCHNHYLQPTQPHSHPHDVEPCPATMLCFAAWVVLLLLLEQEHCSQSH